MSKVRSRNSWIGGGSQSRAPAKTTSSARHISRAKPNFRANHRRRILTRCIRVGLPDLYHAVRTDHGTSAGAWLFPGGGGAWIFCRGPTASRREAPGGDQVMWKMKSL